MLNRRVFLKGFVATGLALNHGNLFAETLMNMSNKTSRKLGPAIYCVVDNPELEAALKTCAEEIDCEILFDWPNSIELILEHHFIAVVDGSIIDKDVWDMYVELCNDGEIKVPCLLVGSSEHLQMPKQGSIYHLALNDHDAIEKTIKNIKCGLLTSA
ncbi:MAG: hypothetical protein HZB61_03290 [Nitrospirae bacterium]|nr:hypothetical protein [Nitrospirota bacterium]